MHKNGKVQWIFKLTILDYTKELIHGEPIVKSRTMHQIFWRAQTFSKRALGMPLRIVETGDVAGPEIKGSDFVGVVGISDWLDFSHTVCNAFSIRRLQLKRFLAFSAMIKKFNCVKVPFKLLEVIHGKRKYEVRIRRVLDIVTSVFSYGYGHKKRNIIEDKIGQWITEAEIILIFKWIIYFIYVILDDLKT